MLKEYSRDSNLHSILLDGPTVWITDVFDQQRLDDVLQKHQLQNPKYIVSDHFSSIEGLSQEIFCAPLFLANNTRSIVKNLPIEQQYHTKHTFNFMINKKQVNRFLCIKLVELFDLDNYDYTWSGVDSKFDLTDILNELALDGNSVKLTSEQQTILLDEINLPPKFLSPGIKTESHITYISNSWTWNHGLNDMFCSSVVSLITESATFQKGTIFTEKTAYALLGKTFPIWVGGGINQAKLLEEMGFDVFNDIIDHSYQSYDTLIERCYYAIKRNLHILTDFDYASKLRTENMDRLDNNQQLLKNKHVDYFCKQRIKQWPMDLQQAIEHTLKYWI